jgi:23S rRNA (cytidine1920-2'-O)/16S rRNA (cytidine1409-2'-O)-methyltransferase
MKKLAVAWLAVLHFHGIASYTAMVRLRPYSMFPLKLSVYSIFHQNLVHVPWQSKTTCSSKKVRVGDLLVEQGLATDAKHASALIMAGAVIADESTRIDSAATKVDSATPLRVRGQKSHKWVSRGGLKLDHAVKYFNCSVHGKVAIDVGCSTGGFTHVLLEAGIKRVYAVDVGYGQLALSLRNDPRVIVLERCNARNLTTVLIPEKPSVVVCDASFIPLHKVLPASLSLCDPPSILLALIKPQFEAERDEVESGTGGMAVFDSFLNRTRT